MGRPRFNPTDEQRDLVNVGLAAGMTTERLSKGLRVSKPVFLRAFREEIQCGGTNVSLLAAGTLVTEMRTGGPKAIAAACFWLKCREGWQETSAHRLVDGEGKDRDMNAAAVLSDRLDSLAKRMMAKDDTPETPQP